MNNIAITIGALKVILNIHIVNGAELKSHYRCDANLINNYNKFKNPAAGKYWINLKYSSIL